MTEESQYKIEPKALTKSLPSLARRVLREKKKILELLEESDSD
jgi:hypothetical protein